MVKIAAIYIIKNINNGKLYIGSSMNAECRIRVHKSKLRLNRHHSKHLQNSYNLDPTAFQFEMIELFDLIDRETLEQREQYWIDHFKTYINDYGYNAIRTVSLTDSNRMKERWAKPGAREKQSQIMKDYCSSPAHRKKLSLGHIEHFKDPSNRRAKLLQNPGRKRVLYVESGQIFESISEAAKILGVSAVKIRDSFTGKRKSNGGMSFKLVINE